MSILGYLQDMYNNPARYRKFWWALLTPAGALVFAMAPLEAEPAFHITSTEWYQVLASLGIPTGVWAASNAKEKK